MIGSLAENLRNFGPPRVRGNQHARKDWSEPVAPESPEAAARRAAFYADHAIPKPGPRVRYGRKGVR